MELFTLFYEIGTYDSRIVFCGTFETRDKANERIARIISEKGEKLKSDRYDFSILESNLDEGIEEYVS
jgi:hypothetical protein